MERPCWTSFYSRWGSAFLPCPSPTLSAAIASEEKTHACRIHSWGRRDRGAPGLSHLGAPAAGKVLSDSRGGNSPMTLIGWVQIIIYGAIIVALVKPLGGYMTRVFSGEATFLSPILQPLEAVLYRT